MRLVEIIIPILLAVYLLWRHPRPLAIRLLPSAAFVIMLIHLAVEGYRWQMLPLYFLIIFLLFSSLIKLRSASKGKPPASHLSLRLVQGSALILLMVSTALPILLPVPAIPAPDGPYKVGTRNYDLSDTSRNELYSGRDEARRFQIQVWYPAEPASADNQAQWMNHPEIFTRSISEYLGLPPFFLDHLALVKLPAYQASKAATTDERHPIILFSYGWNGFNAQNTGQALQLASHGFVVVTVHHPYGAVVTVFDDGTVARNNPAALPMDAPDEEYDIAADKLVDQWAGDLAYALDFMAEQNSESSSPFFKKLDLARVGAYGHSTGGGAAIQFCGTDPRCKAVLGQDPFMRPVSTSVLENGVTQPSFYIFSQTWADNMNSLNNRQFKPFYASSKNTMGAISIHGTTHYDFSDLPRLSPLAPQLGLKGPINVKRVTTIVDDYLLSFFATTLQGKEADLLSSQTQIYSEVKTFQ